MVGCDDEGGLAVIVDMVWVRQGVRQQKREADSVVACRGDDDGVVGELLPIKPGTASWEGSAPASIICLMSCIPSAWRFMSGDEPYGKLQMAAMKDSGLMSIFSF